MQNDRVGRYRLDRPLGTGAFGLVWLAHDDELEAPVAVKILAENWSFRLDLRERFLTEARLLRQAASDRVVQVHDIGELPDGRPYFVMEYASGGTLADRLEGPGGRALPVPEALRLAAETARGVAVLHAAGIVHRDLKPSNVLLQASSGDRPRVLVADLGLAKSLAHASGLTLSAGSAGYMAPEQADPGDDGLDERADVYGLGALTYHLLTGTVPAAPGKVVRPDRLRPDLPSQVQRAVMRALQPERERRWPSAAHFADVLEALADPRAAAHARRRRAIRRTLAVAVALAALVVGTDYALDGHLPTGSAADSSVKVSDATGAITVQVPTAWAGQLRDSGWDPGSLGLKPGQQPAVAVADHLTDWQDLGKPVDGVFIGLTDDARLDAKAADISHPDCRYQGSRPYHSGTWNGRIRRWTDCAGKGRSVEEISLDPAGGHGRHAYVEIRQHDGSDAATPTLAVTQITQ